MTCPRCQQDNPTHARFCLGCGARLALACGSCGTELPLGARFCLQCGQAIAAGAAAPVRSPAPETYTPRHLAEKILIGKAALEGERKQVTVLFADLKGSMELLADRDPEEARKFLDPVLEQMMEAVHRYEGTVNQVMGDGIMALFGAPLAHEDHAVRACYAALRMQESVKRYAEEMQRTAGVPISIRVGLNSGEVVVRSIGSDLRVDYTAVGQTTHLAARMEQTALPGSVLLAPDTLRLAEGYIDVRPLGPVAIKGFVEPLEVFELTGAGTARTRLQVRASRGLTRFVGRDAEMETIRQALERARSGHGQLVALIGEAGLGKSRVVWEVTHSHRTHGWLVLECGSVSYGKATAYLPAIDLLKTYCQIEGRDDARRIRERVTGKLLTLDGTLGPTLPAFLALLDVAVEDPGWQALDPRERRQRTLDAVKRLLLRESQVQPLLLVFEDLHWIDGETQALLDGLVESLPTTRMLLLVNYRPEYEHRWGGKTYYTQLRLDPLPAESARELLDGLLGTDASVGRLKPLLIARTEGNPFFLEESVRALVEVGTLAGERGAHRLARPPEGIQVPATVQAVLASRIDRLPADEKRLLQSAAVIGKDVPLPLLLAIAGAPEEDVRRGLAHLQGAEFLYETSLFPDPEYTFKHALTHEVAYGSLLQERRRDLHARIMEAIERLHAGRLAEHVERLAHHAVRGERWERAVALCRQVGAKALARSATREAAEALEQALVALAHRPEDRATRELAVDIRCDLQGPLVGLGELDRMLAHLQQAEVIAAALEDQSRLGWVSAHMTTCFWWMGEHERAVESGRRAQAIAAAVGDLGLRVLANFRLGQAYFGLGELTAGAEVMRWNMEALLGDLERQPFAMPVLPAVSSRAWLGFHHANIGEFGPALGLAEKAVHIAEAADHQYSLCFACQIVGRIHVSRGNPRAALPWLERGLDLCRRGNFAFLFPGTASELGRAWALTGRTPAAVELLEQAAGQVASMRTRGFIPEVAGALAEVYLEAGRVDDALASARRALDEAIAQRLRLWEGSIRWLLSEIHSRSDPPDLDQAERSYRQALATAERVGLRPLAALCHLGLARLHRRAGRPEPARAELDVAIEMFRAMDVPHWLARAEAEQANF